VGTTLTCGLLLLLLLLQGGSGAGKTTLMDVIAGRKTAGRVTGDIRVNGLQLQQSHFQGLIGYVSICMRAGQQGTEGGAVCTSRVTACTS
jgi:ABC-type uncharacterized transport system ATPase subunit